MKTHQTQKRGLRKGKREGAIAESDDLRRGRGERILRLFAYKSAVALLRGRERTILGELLKKR